MLIQTKQVERHYRLEGGAVIEALRGVDFVGPEGEIVAILGKSGSGKSTLLNMLGGLDRPSSGMVEVGGVHLESLSSSDLADFRLRTVGFVFQSFNLSKTLRAWENVSLPLIFAGVSRSDRRQRALALLDRVGLAERAHHRPGQLSAGEQQRTALARAVANEPKILLADEPTGNLDTNTSREIMDLLTELNKQGMTIVMVTHDPELAEAYASRIVRMADGRICEDVEKGSTEPEGGTP